MLENALKQHARIALRSEKHGDPAELYVDADQLALLDTPDWQVIFGRRGTGKTLLFRMLVEQSCAEPAPRQLSVLITAQDCRVTTPTNGVSDRTRALGYFQAFMELLVTDLTSQLDDLLGRPTFLSAVTGQRRRVMDRAVELVIELLDLVNRGGGPLGAFSEIEFEGRRSAVHKSQAGGGGALHVKATGPTARAELSASTRRETEESTSERVAGRTVIRLSQVRGVVVELLELLDIERLNILIDEWSTLDPSAATGVQPEFGELLKQTFQGCDRVTVKIATNRYQTRFSNRGAGSTYRGLELEADLFTATNLDRAVLDRARLISFYESLLFKRLASVESNVRMFDPRGTGKPAEMFLKSIFKDTRAFETLVKGAEGVPRDFLVLVNSVARERRHTLETRWDTLAIEDVLRQRSVEGQDDIEFRSVTSQLLNSCVRAVATRTRSRVFFVERADEPVVRDALDELLEKRLIHPYPAKELPGFARDNLRAYLVDYGLWLDWERAIGADAELPDESRLPASAGELADWRIDPRLIEREDRIRCVHCGHVFTSDAASYDRKGLCPECFEPATVPAPPPAEA